MIDPGMKQAVLQKVECLREELIELTSALIRIPSVNPTLDTIRPEEHLGGETQVNQFLQQLLSGLGLQTDLWEEEPGRANLVSVWKGTRGGRSLLFNGHVDTVAPGSFDSWTVVGPYSGNLIDGKIYGRGATDMKGGIAAAIMALKGLHDAGLRLNGDVIIETVAGEEMMNTEVGTGAAIHRGYRADAGVVMEPSGAPYRLAVVCTSPGALILTINVRGKAAHTLLRNELVRAGGLGAEVAVSAIDKAWIIYHGLARLEEEWGQTKTHPAFERPGSFTICPTTFAGGLGGIAFIPDTCMMKYVIWHAPQETQDQVKKEIEAQIQRFADTDPWLRENPPSLDWHGFWWPPYDLPPDAPICSAAVEAYDELFGIRVKPTGFMGVDDATFLNQAGIPTITMGPGTTRIAHTANEYIEVEDLVDAAKLYALLMMIWCGV